MIESLEHRWLLATLTIVGSDDAAKADNIVVKMTSATEKKMQVINNGSASITVNGSTVAPGGSNSKTNIDKIDVNLRSGNDKFATSQSDPAATYSAAITLRGGSGNDTIAGNVKNDTINGEDGNDSIDAGSGADQLFGGNGNDTIAGGKGADRITGGLGSDMLSGGDDGDVIYGDDNDTNLSEDSPDTIFGGSGIDYISGEGGADSLSGDAGDDFFNNVDGVRDTVNGGDGNDRATGDFNSSLQQIDVLTSIENANSVVTGQALAGDYVVIDGTAGSDTITVSVSGDFVTAVVNNVTTIISVTAMERQLAAQNGSSNIVGLVVRGLDGNDRITLNNTLRQLTEVVGGNGNDTITGSGGSELLIGSAGDDSIKANGGNDTVMGGSGNDKAYGGTGNDWVYGDLNDSFIPIFDLEVGQDLPEGNFPVGTNGNDYMRGEDGDDRMFGNGGNDNIDGGQGTDFMKGGSGTDTSDWSDRTVNLMISLDDIANDGGPGGTDNVGADFENIIGGTLNDSLVGNGANNNIDGRGGNDTIRAGSGNDTLLGGSGNDVLRGENGNDRMEGGDGNDNIDGAAGVDDYIGGAGSDTADFTGAPIALFISLDNVANDGGSGGTDNVRSDIETVIGGEGPDRITGSSSANRLEGRGGNDTILGLGGNDTIVGGNGADSMDGGDGDDRFFNKDTVKDSIFGGNGADTAENDPLDVFSGVETKV